MLWHFLVERHVDGLTPSMYDVEEKERAGMLWLTTACIR